MIVNVVRLPGDKAAPEPLVDEVMTAAHVATVKGRCYIDRMGTSKEDVTISAPLRAVPEMGALAAIYDANPDDTYRGKVKAMSVSVASKGGAVSVSASFKVERSL